jgi:ketosteroid isomerase-like protein
VIGLTGSVSSLWLAGPASPRRICVEETRLEYIGLVRGVDMGRVTYRGPEGVRKSFDELYEGFDRLAFDVERLIEVGDRIVALGQMYARGRSTGVEAQIPLAIVFTANQDGKLVRYESFRNTNEALGAVGLEE